MKPIPNLVHCATAACLVPLALHAQPSRPSSPSGPSAASVPTLPSQAVGVPYPSSLLLPGRAFQPAGSQAAALAEDVPEPLQLRAVAGIERDSNVVRARTNPVADTAVLLGVGLRMDKRLGLQRLRIDVEVTRYKYARQSSLDHSLFNYALAWDWAFGRRLHGVLAADRKEYREVLTDPVGLGNRMGRRIERTEWLDAVYDASAAWRLAGTVAHTSARSSEPGSYDANPDLVSARIGVGYEWPSGTSLYGRYRHGDGEYTDPAPGGPSGDFKENEVDVVLRWPVGGKTSIDARLGRLERTPDDASQGGFSGMVGSAALVWDLTGKTRLVAGVNRDLGASGLATVGYVRNDRIFIGPTWRATSMVTVQLRYDHVSRVWRDVPAGFAEAGRKDSIRALSANIEWQPRRWVAVSGYLRGEQLRSNVDTGYRNTTVGAAVKAFY
jgi:exopolysaccharide biosynthesis operon protein EpsL